MTGIDYIEAFVLVIFGVFAGAPVWLLLFKVAANNERRQQWRVVDSECEHHLAVKE